MKNEEILSLFEQFEAIACEYEGVECWSARELCKLLGYAKWDKFQKALEKAEEACRNAGVEPADHFPRVGKLIVAGKGASREVEDYMLSRYACYLVAQNGDPRKDEIAFAQNYFAIQTRRAYIRSFQDNWNVLKIQSNSLFYNHFQWYNKDHYPSL